MKNIILLPLCFSISMQATAPEYIDEIIQKNFTQQEDLTKKPSASADKSIDYEACTTYIATYISKVLADRGTKLEALPVCIQHEISEIHEWIMTSLRYAMRKDQKQTIAQTTIHKIIHESFERIFCNATTYVSKNNVQPTVEEHIEQLFKTSSVSLSNVDQRLQNEFTERKNKLLAKLATTMKNEDRDYLTMKEIDTAIHTSFDTFIKRMCYHIMWPLIEAVTEQLKKEQRTLNASNYVPITSESIDLRSNLKMLPS